jgi:hypothetical protein
MTANELVPPWLRRGRSAAGCAILAAAILTTSAAGADTPAASSPPSQVSPKRPLPDYDGRGAEPTDAGDVALWIPRVVLSPLYLVSEYVIRWPLSIAIPAAEHAEVPRKLYDFFTFGPEHKAGFAPVGMVDFGFNPSIGVYAFWNDAGFAGDNWHTHVEVWPDDWLAGSVTDHVQIDPRQAAQLRIEGIRRPDHVFYGIGPDTRQSAQSRYGEDVVDGNATYEWRFWRASRIRAGAGIRAARLYDGHYGTDPSLVEETRTGAFAPPPGFGAAYTMEVNRVLLALDTREPWPASGSGLRAELEAEQDGEIGPSHPSAWVRTGASAGAYLDLNQRGRVFGVSLATLFVDPIGGGPIPFTELASLGGDGSMRGYYPGRLVDRSAAVAAAHYLWPIGPWLAGTIEAAVGNVFDEHLQGFRPGRLRFSGDIGLSSQGNGDYPLELTFGMGTETFERGGQVDSFRATLSVNHGF